MTQKFHSNPRWLALEYIKLTFKKSGVDLLQIQHAKADRELSEVDRGLYFELCQGVLREYYFLEKILLTLTRKRPRPKIIEHLVLASYQLLFLDRVPEYAVFSETRELAIGDKLSEPEIRFLHGILNRVREGKAECLDRRAQTLVAATEGRFVPSEWTLPILNCPSKLFDLISWSKVDALKFLAQSKRKPTVHAYDLMRAAPVLDLAPKDLRAKDNSSIRVQDLSSQQACALFAKELTQCKKAKIEVLETCCGKGGKFLGTLYQLKRSDPEFFKRVELHWTASDPSAYQRQVFQTDVAPLVKQYFPEVHFTLCEVYPAHQRFDFIWVDAPCTGFGTLAKHPEIAITRGNDAQKSAQEMSKLQRKICEGALDCLKPGALFFYTVCTLTELETHSMSVFLESELHRKPKHLEWIWASTVASEGFFLILF